MSILDRRLIVVTGKGGVGRSTVAASLALTASERGQHACVVELSGMASLPPLFGLQGRSFRPRTAREGIDVISMTATECLEDFGRRKLRLNQFSARLFGSRVVRSFVEAVPGLHDLLQLGKIENLLREPLPGDPQYDLMVLDAPATGHGLTLMSAARSMSEVTRVGPFHELAENIAGFLGDPQQTAIVVVSLPEELPVHEALELSEALHADGLGPHTVIANQVRSPPIPDIPPASEVDAVLRAVVHGDTLRDLLTLAMDRQRAQAGALQHLSDGLRRVGAPDVWRLPHRRCPDLSDLASALQGAL